MPHIRNLLMLLLILATSASAAVNPYRGLQTQQPCDIKKESILDGLKINKNLIFPITIFNDQSPTQIAMVYELCAGMNYGTNLVNYFKTRTKSLEYAKDLSKMFEDEGYSEQAEFYRKCAEEKQG